MLLFPDRIVRASLRNNFLVVYLSYMGGKKPKCSSMLNMGISAV